jgi:hypothetical protein
MLDLLVYDTHSHPAMMAKMNAYYLFSTTKTISVVENRNQQSLSLTRADDSQGRYWCCPCPEALDR